MTTPAKPARNVELSTPGEVLETVVDKADAPEAPKETKVKNRVREARDFRTMRADEIDHTQLTSPVLSLDGWVCPPAPEAKK